MMSQDDGRAWKTESDCKLTVNIPDKQKKQSKFNK